MSSFRAMTRVKPEAAKRNPGFVRYRDWTPAFWLDNYFGGHQYGIQFDDDERVYRDLGNYEYSPDMEVPEQEASKFK